MRKLMLTLVVLGASLASVAALPSQANAWWGRWGAAYYAYPAYYVYPGAYSYYYSYPAYYTPAYSSFYYTPAYSSYYYTPAYSSYYTPYYYTPAYSSYYYYYPGVYPGMYIWP
jgi:hypothetical protein